VKVLRLNTWLEFQAFYYRNVQSYNPNRYGRINYFSDGKKVTWSWWQFTSHVMLPGFYTLDLSTFNGDEDGYHAWMNSMPAPQEPSQQEPDGEVYLYRVKPRCNPNVRVGPHLSMPKVTMLTAGTEVIVKNVASTNGYLQILNPVLGWVHETFIEPI
jgi:hypothetical protein